MDVLVCQKLCYIKYPNEVCAWQRGNWQREVSQSQTSLWTGSQLHQQQQFNQI